MKKTFTLHELASVTESELIGDPNYLITSFAGLETAGPQDLSFYSPALFDRKSQFTTLEKTNAGALCVAPTFPIIEGKNYLIHTFPALAFQKAVNTLYQDSIDASAYVGIHQSAVIHETCVIAEGVEIGPNAVVDKGVTIDSGTKIGPNCYIGPNVRIGMDCVIQANVTIRERCIIQNRVMIQPGAVIGSCGFGYHTDARGRHTHLRQLGIVYIEDDVDIGANTTIDRARFEETRIKRGTKIDNLVQIGHGVRVGEDNLIVSQTGIAGSTRTGKHVVLGGQVAINGHIELADGVIVTSRSGVSKSLSQAGKYGGVPATKLNEYNRNSVQLKNINKLIKRVETLEKLLSENDS